LARMVDIGGKPPVARRAQASGCILLKKETLDAIRIGEIEKGDVLQAAQLAGIQAAKRCPEIVPLCHPIPLTSVEVELGLEEDGVRALCDVRAEYRTGVEMEALCGVAGALLCIWDMVKYLEKDRTGNYPSTSIAGIRIVSKQKGNPGKAAPDCRAGKRGPKRR